MKLYDKAMLKVLAHRAWADEKGIQHVEEALLLALIAVAAAGIAGTVGTSIFNVFTDANNCLTGGVCP